ncbi:CorA family divalent cation transporter [Corallococcus terminator]|nr:CorA family divalent cation transporter [Corallococcus terminator]
MDGVESAFALLLDRGGGARPLPLEQVRDWKPSDGALWLNLSPDLPDLPRVLEQTFPLPPEVRDILLGEVGRVRTDVVQGDQLILLMQHPDAVRTGAPTRTLRAWMSSEHCVTLAYADQPAIVLLRHRLAQGHGPRGADLFLAFANAAFEETALRLTDFDDALSDLEGRFEERLPEDVIAQHLRRLRRGLLEQRRFVSLARDAIVRVGLLDVAWLAVQEPRMRQSAERASSLLKELDALVERARVLHEDEKARQDDKSQRILYLLTIISGVFLPLSFITGLLGVNLGGIPGTQWNGAFLLLVLVLIVLAVMEWRALRRRELV